MDKLNLIKGSSGVAALLLLIGAISTSGNVSLFFIVSCALCALVAIGG